MKILYFTLDDFDSLQNYHSINADMLREFTKQGHDVYVVSPTERQKRKKTHIVREGNAVFLKVRIGNIQKTNAIEKGISTVIVEPKLIAVIKKYFRNVRFDLILYCTPPITFCKAVEYVKKRDGARAYLLLKDIFPQNAVDMGMLSKNGLRGILYRYFRRKEKRLYRISDRIGCMSPANIEYVLRNNPEINKEKIEICPNSVEPVDMSISTEERVQIRKKYNIPLARTVFVYGGNLGKPQGIPFMLKCLHSQRENKDVFFFIVGSGTEYRWIEWYIEKYKPENVMLCQWLPKEDYDKIAAACDVGMIFLDHRFTIPNFPSRLLSYMQTKLPVLAVTDTATDIGKVIVENGFGWWCESNDVNNFKSCIMDIMKINSESLISKFGKQAYEHLIQNYSVEKSYQIIMDGL